MSDMNYVFLIGRLTADPVFRVAQSSGGSFCTFHIANNRRFKKQNGELAEETSFVPCIAWGKLSEFSRNYLKKGMLVAIEGRLRQNSWQNEEGKTVSTINVVVNNIQILTPKSQSETSQQREEPVSSEDINPVLDGTEDDIPF
ncbi:MAG: single-stranded DNA-binding protein [Leptospiraceae bacterium]|nr:single-stranded DNA-binding protein [Leptospiraceae bacterium]MDW7976725.1 single-stranded DNA-binding protein [Leptospiraceae bacterium]